MASMKDAVERLVQVFADVPLDMIKPVLDEFVEVMLERLETELPDSSVIPTSTAAPTSSSMPSSTTMHREEPRVPLPTPPLVKLPIELRRIIFTYLDRVSSTCLGLSSKTFYETHRDMRGIVPLEAYHSFPPSSRIGMRLWTLLDKWIGPNYELKWPHLKFRPKGTPWYVGVPVGNQQYAQFVGNWTRKVYEAKARDLRELGGYLEGKEWRFPFYD